MSYGIRYIVIGLGGPDEPCTEEDLKFAERLIAPFVLFKVTILSEEVSDKLTTALLQERGAL